uniref:DNA-directed RNA polymerase subunit n=1 Tax=Halimeda micronesica TaxID=170426 RepID=A0A386AX96_9CHLO|nr:RNA polymerase b-subunit [Halimeda micronesica]
MTGLRLSIATSKLIRQWAQRELPNGKKFRGQILNPKTVNYQTLKPERDGLFCERIFGPINDSLCACGRPPLRGEKFCARCEVEYISSRVRRYRLGYIQLITAGSHIWFSYYLSLFLNLPKKKIECLVYCTQNISRTIYPKEIEYRFSIGGADLGSHLYLQGIETSASLNYSPKKADATANAFLLHLHFLPKYKMQRKQQQHYLGAVAFASASLGNEYLFFSASWRKQHSQKLLSKTRSLLRVKRAEYNKSLWKNGGLRDSALYFGISLISKMSSWSSEKSWFCFLFFVISSPKKGDILSKWYSGPPGLVNFWGLKSRLFCFTGIQLMRTWLAQFTQHRCDDGRLLEIQIRLNLLQLELKEPLSDHEFVQKVQLFRRFKYLRTFRSTQINPASMVLSVLPVLPPDLRPILKLENNQIAISDLNKLYQTILIRNRRLSRLTNLHHRGLVNFHCLNSEAVQYGQRLLQESIDDLIANKTENTIENSTENSIENRTEKCLKSLSDLLKGKKGRFRQNLLGKRVDYSGRSVIVVGPQLKIYECGLPKQIAYELFQPFILRILLARKAAKTVLGAKKLYSQLPRGTICNIIQETLQAHPILLNRAPSLHRLSIQAFQPRLIDGKAILLHPLVCSAFNADFDGDQMGVHLPLCFEARAEAWKIAWSQNNLFSVATSSPICLPSQDMILGSSFLTIVNTQKLVFNILKEKKDNPKKSFASSISLISNSSKSYGIKLRNLYWGKYSPYFHGFETDKKTQKLIEIRININGNFQKFRSQFYQQYHSSGAELLRKIRTTDGRIEFYQSI